MAFLLFMETLHTKHFSKYLNYTEFTFSKAVLSEQDRKLDEPPDIRQSLLNPYTTLDILE